MPCDTVAARDIAAIELQWDDAIFNRRLKFNVGKGFFERELEEKLVGLRRGYEALPVSRDKFSQMVSLLEGSRGIIVTGNTPRE